MSKRLTVFFVSLLCSSGAFGHPAPAQCFGPALGVSQHYEWTTRAQLAADDRPTGFRSAGRFRAAVVFQDQTSFVLRVQLEKLALSQLDGTPTTTTEWTTPLFARVDRAASVQETRVHREDDPTAVQLKTALVKLLLKRPSQASGWTTTNEGWTRKATRTDKGALLDARAEEESFERVRLSVDHVVVVEAASVWQNVSVAAPLHPEAVVRLSNSVELKLLEEREDRSLIIEANDAKSALRTLTDFRPPEDRVVRCFDCTRHPLKELLQRHAKVFVDSEAGSLDAAVAFIQLLNAVRDAGAQQANEARQLRDALKALKKEEAPFLLDVFAAAQTEQSVREGLDFVEKSDSETAERFLNLLAVGALRAKRAPTKQVAELLLKAKFKDSSVRLTQLLAVGSVLRAHRKQKPEDEALHRLVIERLLKELAACKDDECRSSLFFALANTRTVDDSTLPVLEAHASKGGRAAVAALSALVKSEARSPQVDAAIQKLLQRVVFDSSLDSSVRLLAADGLHNARLLRAGLKTLPHEVATLIHQRTLRTSEDWQTHAHLNGTSAFVERVLGAVDSKIRSSKSAAVVRMSLEQSAQLLKESAFDVLVTDGAREERVLSVGLFGQDLHSLAGGSGEPSAGLQLSLLDSSFRPKTLFRGSSELLAHVWSGTGSEPTQALAAHALLNEQANFVDTVTGWPVSWSLTGAVGAALTGQVSVSLWNRNSQSNVAAKAALLFQLEMRVQGAPQQLAARASFGLATSGALSSDVDFYEAPVRTCLRLTLDDSTLRLNRRKLSSGHSEARRVRRTRASVHGHSVNLHARNNAECARLL